MKKHCVAKILQGILETFLYEKICNYNFHKVTFVPFCCFVETKSQNQVGGLPCFVYIELPFISLCIAVPC